jgi:hypothetical protein
MTITPTRRSSRGHTIAQLVVSIVSLLTSLAGLFGMAAILVLTPAIGTDAIPEIDQLRGILWIMLLLVLLPIPSLVLSIRELSGKQETIFRPFSYLIASLILLLVPLLVLLGSWLSKTPLSGWLLPLVNILIVLIPLAWFVITGSRGLAPVTAKRKWGLSVFSVYVTLPAIITIEIIVAGIGAVVAGLWLLQLPEFSPLVQQFSGETLLDPLSIQVPPFDWMSLLQRTEVIAAILFGVSLIVPLIEEALKPAALWVLFKRLLSPTEGFIAGMICGAAFALIESLFSLGSALGEDWVFTAVGRVGTGLLHTFTAGLNGWAIASTWQDGRALRVAVTYTITVLIHGVWNLFALLMGISRVGTEIPITVDRALLAASTWVLAAMFVLMLAALFLFNLRLRHRSSAPPPLPPEISSFIE